MKKTNQLRWLWLTVFVFLMDQTAKFFLLKTISMGEPGPVIPMVNIVLTQNTGASFGFLAGAGGWQRWLFIVIAIVMIGLILYWLYKTPRKKQLQGCALAMILGGALGNLYDRVILGYVVDYIDWHIGSLHFPAYFNVADVAICVGVGLWIIDSMRKN